ncbi:MAG: hypothetical protein LKI25_00940 [Atopobiaceae bacterium]|jgi:polyhydroxyalkanoate synthesis regulator phasin|nr:hypothetical protein [Atopobiaceae bacterium]MCI2172779.1 hypothetical protein [Atopobiaceae bacterium]MCI2207086.1 hypothetical protein [Atopobiaceae bacterium]
MDQQIDLTEGIRKVFLAGVGAIAMGAEKGQEVVDDLVKKGELTVEQGKALNQELTIKAKAAATDSSDALLRSKLESMTADERAAYVAHLGEIAADVDAKTTKVEVDADEADKAE